MRSEVPREGRDRGVLVAPQDYGGQSGHPAADDLALDAAERGKGSVARTAENPQPDEMMPT